jgi:hypothetical protein
LYGFGFQLQPVVVGDVIRHASATAPSTLVLEAWVG